MYSRTISVDNYLNNCVSVQEHLRRDLAKFILKIQKENEIEQQQFEEKQKQEAIEIDAQIVKEAYEKFPDYRKPNGRKCDAGWGYERDEPQDDVEFLCTILTNLTLK